MLNPLTTLTYVAGATERISLGTSIIDMYFQNPILLSKKFTALDILSDERTVAQARVWVGQKMKLYEVAGIPYRDKGNRLMNIFKY